MERRTYRGDYEAGRGYGNNSRQGSSRYADGGGYNSYDGYGNSSRYGSGYNSYDGHSSGSRYDNGSRQDSYNQYGSGGRQAGYGQHGGSGYGRYEEERPVRRRRKKKKRSHLPYVLLVTFLGLAILCLLVVVLFKVQKMEITGNRYCTDRQVKDMVQNDKYSVNALYIFGKYMAGKGEVLPCFEHAKVTLKAPWHVKVEVKEKTIIGYITEGEENIYFDKEGLVIYISGEVIEGLPKVEGIPVKNTKLYQKMESGDPGIFEEILETTRELKKYEITPKKLVCKDGGIYLYVNNVRVSLGNTVSAEKIAQIPPIMEKLGRKKGTLHMENYSENRETITFEKKKAKKKEKDAEKEN